jgi:aromatic-ring opening dioxygenase LigAB LigA subunit
VSIYAVNKLCRRLVHEPELREQLQAEPEPTLRAVSPPLSDEEIQCILDGDVGRLGRMGANFFLLHMLGRFELFGLSLPEYGRRIRREYATERADWASKRDAPA